MQGPRRISWSQWTTKTPFLRHFQPFFQACTGSPQPQLFPIQEQCIPHIVGSDKNLLICGPTGCGKTLIFEMLILNCIYKHYLQKKKPANSFKALYLAPTKAVCQQKQTQFTTHFTNTSLPSSLKATYLSPDLQHSQQSHIPDILSQTNIIICTPQMCNYLIRRHFQCLDELHLFLVDEVHMVGSEGRGCNLELIVNRFRYVQERSQANLRIACVSASVGNKDEIAMWLGAELVENDTRPIPIKYLQHPEITFQEQDYQKRTRQYVYKLIKMIQYCESQFPNYHSASYVKGKQNYLIFCSSRKDTQSNCKNFIKLLTQQRKLNFENRPSDITIERVKQLFNEYDINNKELLQCLLKRVGYHNANLREREKKLIEELMRKNWIIVLFSTTTLAQGVNLPVKVVIIFGLGKFEQNGEETPYTYGEIDQMIGRAGRSRKDEVAFCMFLDKQNNVNNFQQWWKHPGKFQFPIQPIESNLMDDFKDFVFFQAGFRSIKLQNQQNFHQLVQDFKKSLYMIQNNTIYATEQQKQQFLTTQLKKVRDLFHQYDLQGIALNTVFQEYFISIDTYMSIFNSIKNTGNKSYTHLQFLQMICQVSQIAVMYRYRSDDLLGPMKKIEKTPFGCKLKGQPNRILSRNKAIYLIQLLFMGRSDVIQENEVLFQQSIEIIKLFKLLCRLIHFINFNTPQFTTQKCQDPNIVFYCQLYLKYCSLQPPPPNPTGLDLLPNLILHIMPEIFGWASHMNTARCWSILSINDVNVNKKMNFLEQKMIDDIGFFEIKNKLQADRNYVTFWQNLYIRVKNIIKSFKIVVENTQTGHILKPLGYRGLATYFFFKKVQNKYIYSDKTSANMVTRAKKDKNQYLILVNYQKIIGLDTALRYKKGKIEQEIKFTNHCQISGICRIVEPQNESQNEDEDEEKENIAQSNISQRMQEEEEEQCYDKVQKKIKR